jgi:hypothetical protein
MFYLPTGGAQGGGGCNWAIALVLLCVIDGLSVHVYPTPAASKKQETRFKQLIRDKLHWGSAANNWYDKAKAAAVLYTEFRNPLVHELAADKAAKARPAVFKESAVGKWGFVTIQNLETLEAMTTWNDSWPTLGIEDFAGGKRLKLSCAGLYWAVKTMTNALAADAAIIERACKWRQSSSHQQSLWTRLRQLVGRQ